MTRAATARLCVWEGGGLWIGRIPKPIDLHAHDTLQVTVALTGEVRFRTRSSEWASFRAAVVPSAHRHAFDGSTAGLLARIFVDAESAEGRSLAAVFARNGIQAPPKDRAEAAAAALLATWGQTRAPVRLVEAARRALDALGAKRATRVPLPPAVARALDLVRARAAEPVTPATIAKEVGVPVATLRSALDQAAGLPFRNYLMWLRVARAAACLTAGKSAAEAARESGFGGAAELNRVFSRLFGVAPAAILHG